MNKIEFISALAKQLSFNENDCRKINDVLESELFIGKKNKDIIINKLIAVLKCDDNEANNIYNTAMSIISSNIKDKLLHPFKGKD